LDDGSADLCGRLGGEEFAILLPETSQAGAKIFCERLCAAIPLLAFDSAGTAFGVSASIGTATLIAQDDSFATLLRRADAAFYRAKTSGRDRVVLACH
jgi:diguanylate cyclase (GGDEF)-like protein